jgi:hypothetical protein
MTRIGVPIPLAPHRLDELPAVEARQHQVEHAHVGALEAQACEREVAAVDAHRVETRGAEVSCDRLRDHRVVLDDEHLRHRPSILRSRVVQLGTAVVKISSSSGEHGRVATRV